MRLYDIAADLRAALDSLEEGQEAAGMAALAEITFEDKVRATTAYIRELEAEQKAQGEIMVQMEKRYHATEKRIANLKTYLLDCIALANVSKPLRYPEFTVSRARIPQTARIVDEALIPAEYKTTQTVEVVTLSKVDKTKLNADVAAGVIVPGAALEPLRYRLTIK